MGIAVVKASIFYAIYHVFFCVQNITPHTLQLPKRSYCILVSDNMLFIQNLIKHKHCIVELLQLPGIAHMLVLADFKLENLNDNSNILKLGKSQNTSLNCIVL